MITSRTTISFADEAGDGEAFITSMIDGPAADADGAAISNHGVVFAEIVTCWAFPNEPPVHAVLRQFEPVWFTCNAPAEK
jgi:hypothetical protein